jgi:diaminohydroxyphosphoribosylaminopyrimidine deaminase/5-amino-6-(5-phosphoribosylamino)uracil reductase
VVIEHETDRGGRGASAVAPAPLRATDEQHWAFMGLALAAAERALGRVSPNPAVGAALARDGQVVGVGHTQPPGQAHAEIMALRAAGARARGATLYTTLEPCSHHGRTPPCVDALLAAGVAEVYAAVVDPFPAVNGRGLERLRAAGVAVHIGLRAEEARGLLAGFFHRLATGRPLVTVKYAMTLDGRIATHTGHSRWITGPEARREVHRQRDRADAILVGVGTVLADDPLLTTRLEPEAAGAGGPHHPLRIVLDSQGRTPPTARLLRPDLPGRTLIACTAAAPEARRAAWARQGIEALVVPGEGPRVDLPALLALLGERGVNTLLVEGGGETIGAFFAAGLVDRVHAFIAPALVGGQDAPGPIGGAGVATMADAWRLRDVTIQRFGADLMVSGKLKVES